MTFEGGWGPDSSGQYPGQAGRLYNERLEQAAQNAGPPEPSLTDTGLGMVLSLAAGYFVVAVLANFALYDTFEEALPSILNTFIWTSVFFLIPIGLLLWMLVSWIRRR